MTEIDAQRRNSEKLFGAGVGDYRILYEVNYNVNLIGIVKFQFVLTDISQSRHTTYLPNRQFL